MKVSAFILNRTSGKFYSIWDKYTAITSSVIYVLKYIVEGLGYYFFDARYFGTSD